MLEEHIRALFELGIHLQLSGLELLEMIGYIILPGLNQATASADSLACGEKLVGPLHFHTCVSWFPHHPSCSESVFMSLSLSLYVSYGGYFSKEL